MNKNELKIQSQITFLYYRDLEPIDKFYQEVIGLELVEDQGWAKIYRVSGDAYLGIVDEKRGFQNVQEEKSVLVTFAVNDVFKWREYLESKGVKMLTDIVESDEIQVRCFFCEDPGGYAVEIEQFLRPEAAEIFHRGA
jgi:lactoylglutathione lyase